MIVLVKIAQLRFTKNSNRLEWNSRRYSYTIAIVVLWLFYYWCWCYAAFISL